MKFIIIGLGSFGSTLGASLTKMGHEVIGVDRKIELVEKYKDLISSTISMDSSDKKAMQSLPLKNTDVVVVAIGEDAGASILITALLKELKVKKIIARAVSDLQETVIQAIGVETIVRPEEDAAERLALKFQLKGVVDSIEFEDDYNIVEIQVPELYIGKTVREVDLRGRLNLNILTILRERESENLMGKKSKIRKPIGIVKPDTVFEKDDLMVVFGYNKDLREGFEIEEV